QYFAPGAGVGPPPCGLTRLRRWRPSERRSHVNRTNRLTDYQPKPAPIYCAGKVSREAITTEPITKPNFNSTQPIKTHFPPTS
ncbi:hypothetical protein, partial [Yersinia bercovieri]|uniref:hypothetical protein n=1 Tax=Yersinia bercovieri TaxID=634 RepID=UPI001C6FCE3E